MKTLLAERILTSPISLNVGDYLEVSYHPKNTHHFFGAITVLRHGVEEETEFDTVKLYGFENDFELSKGYVIVLGKK